MNSSRLPCPSTTIYVYEFLFFGSTRDDGFLTIGHSGVACPFKTDSVPPDYVIYGATTAASRGTINMAIILHERSGVQ
jgi:hypothetical protein